MAYTINVPSSNNQQQNNNFGPDIGNGFRVMQDKTHRFTPSSEHDMLVKAIIVGDSSVGKSSLTYRFTDNTFSPSFISTIGVDFKTVVLDKQGKVVRLQIWDTAGQERFRTIIQGFFRGVHACMLVFALDDAESFDNVNEWVKHARQFGNEEIKFVLIGNKLDLVEHNPSVRQVPFEAGQNLAHSLGCEYIETSAKDDNNVGRSFGMLAEAAIQRKLQGQDLSNPNSVRNPHKRIQLGQAHHQANNKKDDGKSLCAGRCN